MMDKREVSVHVRLSDEADAVLEMLATANEADKAKIASDLLHRALLGEAYAMKLAALRMARAGLLGPTRER